MIASPPSIPPAIAAALRACRPHLLGAVAFSALLNLLYLAPTIYMMQVYDRVVPTSGRMTLLYLTLLVMLALGTLAALDAIRARLLVLTGLRLDRLLSARIIEKGLAPGVPAGRQPLRGFDQLRQLLSGPVTLALLDAPWAPIYVIAAFLIHPALGAFIIAGAVILLLIALANDRVTRTGTRAALSAQNAAYATQESIAAVAETVRALGMREALCERQLGERVAGLRLSADAQIQGGAFSAMTKFVRMFLQSCALGLGAWLAVEHQISGGAIIAASVLLSRALQPVEQLVGAWYNVGQARSAWRDLIELFPAEGAERAQMALPAPTGAVAIEQLTYRPAAEGPVLLYNVSFSIAPGELLVVAGPSGAGKTTLARIVAGAGKPSLGTVRLDGASYADWPSDLLGRHIGYLPQQPSLIAGTIQDNISRFARWRGVEPDLVAAGVIDAAREAGVHELILRLPQGYDTVLGPAGAGLSTGQSQRVALARALYGAPPLLVLDEPNAALDQEGEAALMAMLASARERGAAILMIAHRGPVLTIADRLLLLRGGQIDRIGPTAELLGDIARVPGHPRPVAVPDAPADAEPVPQMHGDAA